MKTSNSASIIMGCSLKCSHTFAEYCLHHFREVSWRITSSLVNYSCCELNDIAVTATALAYGKGYR